MSVEAPPRVTASRPPAEPHCSAHPQQLRCPRLLAVMQRMAEQPQAVQERAAELLEHLLGSCLNPSWFQALPPDISQAILRACGPSTRRACLLLRDTYGPLDSHITLDTPATPQQLHSLLAPHPTRFHHATSLRLTSPDPLIHHILIDPSFIQALPPAFPKLRSLTFFNTPSACGADLSHLSPLSSCLTSIALPCIVGSIHAAVDSLGPLTTLVHVTMGVGPYNSSNMQQVMAALAGLPHLASLEMLDQHPLGGDGCPLRGCVCCTAAWLTCLHRLHLTRLSVHARLHSWDAPSVHALATALPHLQALHIRPDCTRSDTVHHADNASTAQSVLGAIAGRAALTSLRIDLARMGGQANLGCLSALVALRGLHVAAADGAGGEEQRGQLEAALEAMAVHRTLTSLKVVVADLAEGNPHAVRVTKRGVASILALAGCLEELELTAWLPGSFFKGLSSMIALRVLRLAGARAWWWQENRNDPIGLSRLVNLHTLHVTEPQAMRDSDFFAVLFIKDVPSLPALRALTIGASGESDGAGYDDMIHDAQLWAIGGLHKTLTYLDIRHLPEVSGPGLCAVPRLTRLQQLTIGSLGDRLLGLAAHERLHEYLLPLPRSLRRLRLQGWPEGVGVHPSLLGAAMAQDCALCAGAGGAWV